MEKYREEIITEQWEKANALRDFFHKHGVIPLFIGHFAKAAIMRSPGFTEDIDVFLYDEQTLQPKSLDDNILKLIDKVAKEFDGTIRTELHTVILTLESNVGSIEIEFMIECEGIIPQSNYLKRSVTFSGLRIISTEDYIVFKLEALRDRIKSQSDWTRRDKHENDLRDIVRYLQENEIRLDIEVIKEEIKRREQRKHEGMTATFLSFLPEYAPEFQL